MRIDPWPERPPVVANLLNPAYLGVLLRTSVDKYCSVDGTGMPFPLIVLCPVMVLHPGTASQVPKTARKPFHAWLSADGHEEVLLDFPARFGALVPYLKESIIFCVERDVIRIAPGGRFTAGVKLKGITAYPKRNEEIKEHIRAAGILGKMLAGAGTAATVYALMGVRP